MKPSLSDVTAQLRAARTMGVRFMPNQALASSFGAGSLWVCSFVVGLMAIVSLTSGCGSEEGQGRTDPETATAEPIPTGSYDAKLASPGGDLRFVLKLERPADGSGATMSAGSGATTSIGNGVTMSASIHNGPERIEVPDVVLAGEELTLSFPHYDSEIKANWNSGEWVGVWRKRAGDETWTEMAFSAKPTEAEASVGEVQEFQPFLGRWSVQFSESEDPSIGVFQADSSHGFVGTFLTTVGDYRYLSGWMDEQTLWMSCFDGAHAFLFRARQVQDGSLEGEFWSRDSWHERWTAQPDSEALLADGFSLTTWDPNVSIGELEYPDLDGNLRSLDDPAFKGSVRLLHIFGSWCPNCHDAGEYLGELQQRYGDRGLKIQGLAFELTADDERNAAQVRRYLDRHGMDYPVLLVGPSDKSKATERFPLVDRIRSYPTTIFLDHTNQVRAIHTGFSGPATGATHDALKARFEEIISELLAEASSS